MVARRLHLKKKKKKTYHMVDFILIFVILALSIDIVSIVQHRGFITTFLVRKKYIPTSFNFMLK